MALFFQLIMYSIGISLVLIVLFFLYISIHPSPCPNKITSDGGKYVTLKDGRILEYFTFGETSKEYKHLMIEFNGFGCSAYSLTRYFNTLYQSLGIKTIAITIPGFGYSTEQKNRKLNQWHLDVEEVLRKENIDGKFWVKGSSFGTVHAIEVAAAFGEERIEGVILSGSVIPYSEACTLTPDKFRPVPKFMTSGMIGKIFWFLMSKIAPLTTHKNPNFGKLFKKFPHYQEIMNNDLKRGNNHFGWLYNMDLISKPWEFNFSSLANSKIKSWIIFDKEDKLAPYEHSLWLADKISGDLIEIHGYGHGSILDIDNFKHVLHDIFNK